MSEDLGQIDFLTGQPYPVWARARPECPVIRYDGSSFDPRPSYHVTRYEDAEKVLRDPSTFSSSINGEVIGRFMGDLILAMGGQEHRQYRSLVSHTFRASVLERWDAELRSGRSRHRPALLDCAIAPLGRSDLVRDVTSKYPVQVICGIVGVPLEDLREEFVRWAELINTGPLHPEEGMKASVAMREYLEPIARRPATAARRAT